MASSNDLRHQAHVLVDQDLAAVAHRDAGGLLAAVLEGVQPEVGQLGDLLAGGPHPEDATRVLRSLVLRVEGGGQPAVAALARVAGVRHGLESTGAPRPDPFAGHPAGEPPGTAGPRRRAVSVVRPRREAVPPNMCRTNHVTRGTHVSEHPSASARHRHGGALGSPARVVRRPVARCPPADRRGRHRARGVRDRRDQRGPRRRQARGDGGRRQRGGPPAAAGGAHPDRPAHGGDRQGRRLGPAAVRPARAPRPRRERDVGLGPRPGPGGRAGRLAPDGPADRAAARRRGRAARHHVDRHAEGRAPPQPGPARGPPEVRRAGRPRGRHRPGARGPGRPRAAGRRRPQDRPHGQRPAEPGPDPRGQPRGAGRGLPGPRHVDPDLRPGRPGDRHDPRGRRQHDRAPAGAGGDRRAGRPPGVVAAAGGGRGPGATVRPHDHHRAGRADPVVPRRDRHRVDPVRAARGRPRVPRQPRAHPDLARGRLDRGRDHDRARHRARPRPGDPERPGLRARAPAGRGAAGPRHLQEPADRDRGARAAQPAHRDHGSPRDARELPGPHAAPPAPPCRSWTAARSGWPGSSRTCC